MSCYEKSYFNPLVGSIICHPLIIPGGTPVNCTANFLNLQDTSYHPGRKVSFYAASAYPVTTTTFYWTYGDEDTSTAKNPIHIYATGGNYSGEWVYNRNHNHFVIETAQLPKGVNLIKLNSNEQYQYKRLVI